jgi:hypothetical protein
VKVLTAEEVIAINRNPSFLVACCVVEEPDGTITRMTVHDESILVDKGDLAGEYTPEKPISGTDIQSSSTADVGNQEVTVGLDAIDMTANQIRAGRFRGTRYTIFLTDWQQPTNVAIVGQRGVVANISLVNELVAKFELRQMKQSLQQPIIPVVSRSCRVDLGSQPRFAGDAFCGVNLAAYRVEGMVDTVEDRRIFTIFGLFQTGTASDFGSNPTLHSGAFDSNATGKPDGYYIGGLLTWVIGLNAGYQAEVRADFRDSNGVITIQLFDVAPFDIQPFDTFTLVPGCDKARETCRDKFSNIVNFQGEPDSIDLSILQEESPF